MTEALDPLVTAHEQHVRVEAALAAGRGEGCCDLVLVRAGSDRGGGVLDRGRRVGSDGHNLRDRVAAKNPSKLGEVAAQVERGAKRDVRAYPLVPDELAERFVRPLVPRELHDLEPVCLLGPHAGRLDARREDELVVARDDHVRDAERVGVINAAVAAARVPGEVRADAQYDAAERVSVDQVADLVGARGNDRHGHAP